MWLPDIFHVYFASSENISTLTGKKKEFASLIRYLCQIRYCFYTRMCIMARTDWKWYIEAHPSIFMNMDCDSILNMVKQ